MVRVKNIHANTPAIVLAKQGWFGLGFGLDFSLELGVMARCLLVLLLTASVAGCSTLGYYQQAITGQLQLLANRRSLDNVLADPQISSDVKSRIRVAQQVRVFAADILRLPVDDSYSTYVEVGAPYVVWNVFAAPEFDLTMKTFCYPIAGCVSYKGFFSPAPAAELTQELLAQGYDVFYGGVAAYSTLGWFADPILSTFVKRDDTGLALLLFHELAHKVVYIPGDTRFNESFATAIERYGLRQWLALRGDSQAFANYLLATEQRGSVIALIMVCRAALAELYALDIPDAVKRQRKQSLIEALRRDYDTLAGQWDAPGPFWSWMAADINNARLGAVADYNNWVPAFEYWLARLDGDLPTFYAAVNRLAKAERKVRERCLRALMAGSIDGVEPPFDACDLGR